MLSPADRPELGFPLAGGGLQTYDLVVAAREPMHEDPEIDRVFWLWVALSNARCSGASEDAMNRLADPSWDSRYPEIRDAWDALTHPDNLTALEAWDAMGPKNPVAAEATAKALERCRARRHARDASAGRAE